MAFHAGISEVYVVCAEAYDNMIINREKEIGEERAKDRNACTHTWKCTKD